MLKLYIEGPNGRLIRLEDLVNDYFSRPEKERSLTTSKQKNYKSPVSKLKVGEWFLIDLKLINENKSEILRQCHEQLDEYERKKMLERFEEANKIANENPDKYPRFIETFILDDASYNYLFKYGTKEDFLRDCERVGGEGVCDEVIADLELEMRVCNGESMHALCLEPDKLPHRRVLNDTWVFGGCIGHLYPPASRTFFIPDDCDYGLYTFRRKL